MQNGKIRHYNITVFEVATGNLTWFNTTDSSTHWILSSLHPSYAYEVEVAAVTVGLGPFSDVVVVFMPDTGTRKILRSVFHSYYYKLFLAPFSPQQMLNGSRFILNMWQPLPEASLNGIVHRYVVNIFDRNTSDTATNITSPSSQSLLNIGSLEPGAVYTCSVTAETVSQGPFSQRLFTTTKPDGKVFTAIMSIKYIPNKC